MFSINSAKNSFLAILLVALSKSANIVSAIQSSSGFTYPSGLLDICPTLSANANNSGSFFTILTNFCSLFLDISGILKPALFHK
jgi:hypothetical protein